MTPTKLQAAALRIVLNNPGIYPSGLAYKLIDSGDITPKNGRKLRPQGAGFVGGKILAETWRAGWTSGGWPEGHKITAEGKRAIGA